MSTTATATATPAFPAPIPITYSWSTPNALRRLALPPLTTTPPPHHSASAVAVAGPSRSRPVGSRPLPRPPRQAHTGQRPAPAPLPKGATHEYGHIPFPDPYAYQMPQSLVHHYEPGPPAQARQAAAFDTLVPLVQQTTRLSFASPETGHDLPPIPLERERGRPPNKKKKKEKEKENEVERKLSVSGIMARFRKRSRSRSRSRSVTRETGRNLLDDE